MGYPPVVVVESGGVPRTPVNEGVNAPAFTVAESGARPITLADNAPPILLYDTSGNFYGASRIAPTGFRWEFVTQDGERVTQNNEPVVELVRVA